MPPAMRTCLLAAGNSVAVWPPPWGAPAFVSEGASGQLGGPGGVAARQQDLAVASQGGGVAAAGGAHRGGDGVKRGGRRRVEDFRRSQRAKDILAAGDEHPAVGEQSGGVAAAGG